MKLKLFFSFLLLIGTALATDETSEKKKTTTTTTLSPPTSTVPPTSTTPPTTTSASSTTGEPTSTSTSTPTTSTPSTTSNPTTASSTTLNPTTASSTTQNPTTAPSTTPNPPTDKWEVDDPHHNITCILAMMDIEFDINGNFTPAVIMIDPSQARAEGGTCEGNTQILKLVFNTGNSTSFIALSFAQNNSEYHVSGLNASLIHNTTKGFIASTFSNINITLFKTNLNTSYHCSSYEISSKNNLNETLTIKLSKIYLEAFRKTNTKTFSSSHLCAGDIPDIVPLVVGIALAGLVLVVVIAYLIGRRRSQARGYLSM